jgi:hypothetical protein
MDEITQIVGEIVSKIDRMIYGTINPSSGVNEFCATKWGRKGKYLEDSNSVLFRIESIDYDNSIDAVSMPAGTLFDSGAYLLPEPFYISGTKLATNREWTIADSNLMKKTPIIWLLETIDEERFGRGDSREFDASLRIFFLDETDIKNYYTEDHRREVVLPMQNLVEAFIEAINADLRFKPLDSYRMKTFSRFGVEQENGMFQNILDANLSGVELNLSLTKFKANCKC